MKKILISVCVIVGAIASSNAAMPFTPLGQDEPIGLAATIWRFSSSLTKNSSGTIEVCYVEEGKPEQVLGSVPVYPFVSSESKMPDLRILFARDLASPDRKVVLIFGYGLRSAVLVIDVPGLTRNSLVMAGMPKPNAKDEITLLGYGSTGVASHDGVLGGLRGRLFIRYVGKV